MACGLLCAAETVSPASSISSKAVSFGDHDIGTTATQSLLATNNSDVPVNLVVIISGPNAGDVPGDFSWTSSCLSKVAPKASCQIDVAFNPMEIGKDKGDGEERKANLTVSNDRGEIAEQTLLSGKAFQNLGISPEVLEFEGQVGSASGVGRNVRLTNYTSSVINSITVSTTGDFTENHAGCSMPLTPGGSCGILVTFSPKQAGRSSGSLTIAANLSNLGKLPRSIALNGKGLNHCELPRFSFHNWGSQLVLIISGLYFLGLVLVRWHMIAKPARAQLVAEIEAVRSRAVAETSGCPDTPELIERLARIHFLLDVAEYPFKYKEFPINTEAQGRKAPPMPVVPPWYSVTTRFFNALFWTRGQELAGWGLAHEAELQLVALLPLEVVRARLETAEQELRQMNTPLASSLADKVRDTLNSGEAFIVERATQLLQQFQQLAKQMSAQDAARQAWVAGLGPRLLNALQQFSDWAEKIVGVATTLGECNSRLQSCPKAAVTSQAIDSDLRGLSDPPQLPNEYGALLIEIRDFVARLRDAIKQIPDPNDPAVTLDGCNKLTSCLVALGNEAGILAKKLKDSIPTNQAEVYQRLLVVCKAQGLLFSLMTQSTTPSPANALLRDLLASLQAQNELVQKINQAAASGIAADFANCRDLVLQLANIPPLPSDLTTRIENLLRGEAPAPLARWRAVLVEALGLIYESTDNDFSQLASWHNKMMWLVGIALLFMFALAVTLGNAIFLLLGAVGGLLSRLTRTTEAADVPNDYGATWGSLFLSPLTGALSAWGGILLIILGVKLNILGAALNLDWCNPYEPVSLAIALLFGFLERLFDNVTGQLQDKLLKSGSSSPSPATASPASPTPAPKIISISPASASIGNEVQLTVRGANFQRGAVASVTKDTGDPSPAKLDFTDATLVLVTCTPSGAKPFTATVTIANPDKQVATGKLAVTANT
ncbi:MAG TPA: choice-of-anchor D domain-containing protein [Terriglobales bacterium]